MAIIGKSGPAEIGVVQSLIALISDPGAAKARLDELQRHSALADQAAADRQSSNNALTEARRIGDETLALLEAREGKLAALEKKLGDFQDVLSEREKTFHREASVRERDLGEREQRVTAAERTIGDRDRVSQETAERIAAEEAVWREKARRIHEAAMGQSV